MLGGMVGIEGADVLPMFRRCGTGPTKITVRRIRDLSGDVWHYFTEAKEGVKVAAADVLITATELHRFEDDHDLFRPRHSGRGPEPRYGWEAMYAEVVRRVHERGVPDSQQKFINEISAWFNGLSDGSEVPDDSTIRRRLLPIWRALRGQIG